MFHYAKSIKDSKSIQFRIVQCFKIGKIVKHIEAMRKIRATVASKHAIRMIHNVHKMLRCVNLAPNTKSFHLCSTLYFLFFSFQFEIQFYWGSTAIFFSGYKLIPVEKRMHRPMNTNMLTNTYTKYFRFMIKCVVHNCTCNNKINKHN